MKDIQRVSGGSKRRCLESLFIPVQVRTEKNRSGQDSPRHIKTFFDRSGWVRTCFAPIPIHVPILDTNTDISVSGSVKSSVSVSVIFVQQKFFWLTWR